MNSLNGLHLFMNNSPFFNDVTDDNNAPLPRPSMLPPRSQSVQPIKVDYDCSKYRGNYDEGTINDYDQIDTRNFQNSHSANINKASFNLNGKNSGQPSNRYRDSVSKSRSMDLKKDSGNQFVYTPTQDSKLIEGNINESNPPQSPKSERNRRGKGNNNQVNFGGKQVDDHKSNKNKRNNNNNNNNQNNNSSNPNAYTPNVNMSGNAPNSPQRTRSGGGRNKGGGRVTRSQSSNMNCQIRFGQNAQPRQDQQQQQPPPQPQVTEWTGPKK